MSFKISKKRRIIILFSAIVVYSPAAWACDACGGSCGSSWASGTATDSYLTPDLSAGHPIVSASTLNALMTAGIPMLLIDCRNSSCLDGPRIPGAIVIDIDAGKKPLQMPASKKIPIIIYDGCATCSCKHILAQQLIADGYSNVIDFAGGVSEWRASGHATVETNPEDILSLKR